MRVRSVSGLSGDTDLTTCKEVRGVLSCFHPLEVMIEGAALWPVKRPDKVGHGGKT